VRIIELDRIRKSSLYEWGVGGTGIVLSLSYLHDLGHISIFVTLMLLVLAAFLEAIPVPLGKAMGTLMVVVPIGAMVVYGSADAICLITGAELLAPIFRMKRMKLSTWLFNAGQYGLSAWAMAMVFDWFRVGHNYSLVDWHLLLGIFAGVTAFLAVNHIFINVLYVFRGSFRKSDMLQLLVQDSVNFLVALPLAFLVIVMSPHRPLLEPVLILPIALFAQMLRLYRKTTVLQQVHKVTSQLTSEFDVDRICRAVATTAEKLTYADAVVVFIFDPARNVLVPNVIHPEDQSLNYQVEGLTEEDGGVIWKVIRSSDWAYVPDTLRDSRVRWNEQCAPYRSMAIFPMKAHGQVKGVIVCYSLRPYAFSNEATEYIKTLSSQVSVLLDNAQLYQKLQEQSWRDGATGLFNYRFFYEELERSVNYARLRNQVLSVAVIDIDYFKKFNDTYGHLVGDAVLRSIGSLLSEIAGEDAVVARYGGEEFGIIFPYGPQQTFERLEAIRTEVSRYTVEYEGYRLQGITVSSGVASFPEHGVSDRDVLLKADSAMYWGAKQRGRNRTALYTPEFENQLFVDGLTGLYTHHFINIRTREEFDHGMRSWGALCIDLENFSFVNSSFGFDVGDRVLKETSLLIKECLRHTELACRFGGDEFLVLIPDVTQDELDTVGTRIVKAIASHRFECSSSIVLSQRAHLESHRFEQVVDPTDLFNQISGIFASMHNATDESLA
jgi:diguanylate cyclase (GGDEF)-like protein